MSKLRNNIKKTSCCETLDGQILAKLLTDIFQNAIDETINTDITSKNKPFPLLEINLQRLMNESQSLLRNYISKKLKGE
ncbi:MAG: hypothetical protein LBJ61_01890 [Deltaproteobacteria bacterium]|jgi:hypothetical protein|nr:hypothetical protein [Deltaproteobacteria bacterium]